MMCSPPPPPSHDAQDLDTITAVEYLAQQDSLLHEASEVLSGVVDRCSYDKGYVRQRVFSCRTCSLAEGSTAGTCYACFVSCHTKCDQVVELFYKRHFRCDCGTSKLPGKCTLQKKPEDEANYENTYTGNFKGLFCFCRTLYDPDTEEGVMFQCAVCEDWFHDRCIGDVPEDDDDREYVCRDCVEKHAFLRRYDGRPEFRFLYHGETVTTELRTSGATRTKRAREAEDDQLIIEDEEDGPPSRKIQRGLTDLEPAGATTTVYDCIAPAPPAPRGTKPDLFCSNGWRSTLCRCPNCLVMYAEQKIGFVISEEETWEPEDDENADASPHDIGLDKLNRMKKEDAINGVLAYQTMRDDLRVFLKKFADENKAVGENDIREYFAEKENERRLASRRG
ncbi:hypothetical protein HKX48_001378 [Thoreauomyces humboldtii]|nr:hypothetical protein HKX48_001378 [Thoreauomyces humboldtii]